MEKQDGKGGEIYRTLMMFPQQRKECTTGRYFSSALFTDWLFICQTPWKTL